MDFNEFLYSKRKIKTLILNVALFFPSGTAPPKSHHILTLRDLEDSRRPRRISSRSRRSSSPTDNDPSVPMTLRSGGTFNSRCSLFSSPPRTPNLPSTSPVLPQQSTVSPIWNSPPGSTSNLSVGLSPRQGAITFSPRGKQNFRITTPVSAELPQDFLASSEAEDAAVATTNGISLAPDNLVEEVAHLMAQELPYTGFDTDTDVASMLNAKLDFDEALLTENVALACGAQDGRGAAEGVAQDIVPEAENRENDSESEDSSRYFRFARTVVCDAAGSSEASTQLQSAPSIPQLDGADGGSDSDEGDTSEDEARGVCDENGETSADQTPLSPTKQLSVSLERLESIYSLSGASEHEMQEDSYLPPVDILEPSFAQDDELIQEEVVPTSCGASTFQGGTFLDSSGDLITAASAAVGVANNEAIDMDDSSSSSDSVEPFRDDLNDPDYSPEQAAAKKAQPSPLKMSKQAPSKFKRVATKLPLPGRSRTNVPLLPQPVHNIGRATLLPAASASVRVIPRPLASPVVLNGANAFAVQPGATRGKTMVVRLNSSRPAAVGQQQSATGQAPSSPKVLLVNGQGQILLKDPKTNTYQSVSTSSPAYNKISQIAKLLHSGSVVQRSLSHLVIKPSGAGPAATQPPSGASSAATRPPPAALNHTAGEKKVVVRVVPVRSLAPAPTLAPPQPTPLPSVTPPPYPSPAPICTKLEASTTQAIIDRAMSVQCDKPRTEPIILTHRHQERRKRAHRLQLATRPGSTALWWKGRLVNEAHSNLQRPATSAQSQVRVKRVSSLAERPLRKKSKMDFLKDLSNGPDDVIEPRYGNASWLYF